jgi:hypothetical protein
VIEFVPKDDIFSLCEFEKTIVPTKFTDTTIRSKILSD